MDKQQEQQVKELAEEIAEYRIKSAGVEVSRNVKTLLSKEEAPLAQHLISKGWRKAGELTNKPKIVCLCGSTRFTAEMLMAEWEYAKQGIIAIGWFVRPLAKGEQQDHHLAEKEGVHELFDELHKRKIDLADEVLILNVGGYIGESTKSELEYALAHGKKVRYLNPVERDHDREA